MLIIINNIEEVVKVNSIFAVTHSGVFHADDVFSTAMLLNMQTEKHNDLYLLRTRNITDEINEAADIIYDIGFGKYDHHQKDKRLRDDGVPYAAFGLLWETYGREYLRMFGCSDNVLDLVWSRIDGGFVKNIDAADNGVGEVSPMGISSMIHAFNPNWDDDNSNTAFDMAFMNAVVVAQDIFEQIVRGAISKINAKNAVEKAITERKNKRVLILDKFMPWQEYLLANESANEILYVIYPSINGGFNVQAVPDAPESFGMRKPLPNWVGNLNAAYELSGGKITFIHPARFLCASPTLEDAITIAEYAAYPD